MTDKTVVWSTIKNLKYYLRNNDGIVLDITGKSDSDIEYIKWKIQQEYAKAGICEELRYIDISETAAAERRVQS